MKKVVAFFAAAALVVSLASMVFAAESKTGTIKSVDEKSGTVVFCQAGGHDKTFKADKSVDLSKISSGANVEVSVEGDMITNVKASHRKTPSIGC